MKQNLLIKKVVLIIFILLVCFQCGHDTDKRKYQAYLDMKDFVLDEYNRGGAFLLFFKTHDKNKIACEKARDFQSTLHRLSEFNESFYKDIMLGKIILSCEDIGECFTLSPVILDDYKKKGIEKFIETQTKLSAEGNGYVINPILSNDKKLSIAYFFYLNNIYTVIDEYTGHYISWKDLTDIKVTDDFDWEDLIIKEE